MGAGGSLSYQYELSNVILLQNPIKLLPGAVLLFCCVSCGKSTSSSLATDTSSDSSSVISPTLDTIVDARLKELSGIAASTKNNGVLYVHNDSGDSSRFFAIGNDGSLLGIFHYNADPNGGSKGVVDVEDIAVGPGVISGTSYVYLGDIGDNDAVRKFVVIYRVPEPSMPATGGWASVNADALFLRYPDGAHDAETLMLDPVDRLLYIVTKREDSVGIYTAPLDFNAKDTLLLTKQAHVYFAGSGLTKYITAGDISQKGDAILVKSYSAVYYWKRSAGIPVWKTLQQAPVLLSYTIEPQGEAIGFSADGKKYYTTSEGSSPTLYCYTLP